MPIMPTRVNRVPRLGQPAQLPAGHGVLSTPQVSDPYMYKPHFMQHGTDHAIGSHDEHRRVAAMLHDHEPGSYQHDSTLRRLKSTQSFFPKYQAPQQKPADVHGEVVIPRLGQPASYATPDSQTYGYDAGLPPSPSGSIPSLSNSHQSRGIPQGDAFGLMPGRTGSRSRNFPAIGTGVLAGSNGVRNQGSLNAGQGVTAIPTQQPSYVSRPVDNPFPYEHDYGTGNSQQFDVSMQNLRDRQRSANSLLQRNIGAGGYGGIGGMSDGAAARQAELVNPLVAANNLQQQRNNYGSWERGQLRLGGAKQPDIVQSQEAPTLPTTSQFSVPSEGSTRLNSGTTIVQNGEGSRLIGEGVMGALKSQGYSASDLIPGSKNYNTARQILQAATSQAENARIAAQTAAGGGLSRAGQYDQRQKDIKALRYAKQRPTSIAFNDAMSRLKQRQAVQAQQLAAITGQPAVRSAPTVVNTPQVQATMQTVPNPVFSQDPFGMPGSIPPRQQQYPTTYWGALQSMLYGNNPAHGGSGNYGR